MKKYRTTKEHPYLREGLEFEDWEIVPCGRIHDDWTDSVDILAKNHPTWFEEIDSRWKPKYGEEYFTIDSNGNIFSTDWINMLIDKRRWEFGNCFKIYEEAEQARDKVCSLLLNLH